MSTVPGAKTIAISRVLYFDIDGVLLDYEDKPKQALVDGRLQEVLKAAGFTRLVCVSGWSDMVQEPVARIPIEHRKSLIHGLFPAIFPDREWFLERLALTTDTDHRCRHIDLNEDWYYCDDWADQFFAAQFGAEAYERHLGSRVLLVDPHRDGGDLLEWVRRLLSM